MYNQISWSCEKCTHPQFCQQMCFVNLLECQTKLIRITVVSIQSLLQSSLHIRVTFTLFTQSAMHTNEVAWKNPFVHYAPASTACHYLHCRDFDVYKWIQNIFVFVLFRLSTIRRNILWEIFLVNSSWQISHLFFTMDS